MTFTRSLPLLAALALMIALPVLLRTDGEGESRQADARLVIITPHNEATRSEFTEAFTQWLHARTGQRVTIDWRTPGGGSEIARYIASEFTGAFRLHWERDLGRPWSSEVEAAFANPAVEPGEGSIAAEARAAFLTSEVSCGIDLFFGGGSFDAIAQARAGRLVTSGIIDEQPEWFGPGGIPEQSGGEPYRDPQGRWIGATLSSFGICYHPEAIARLGITTPPSEWSDLANPRLLGNIALSDPTQSASAAKAFEMLLQQQIAAAVARGESVEEGWAAGMRLIRRIAANARYFTDSASKVPWDVEAGDAAAGMVIDFYGRFQSEATYGATPRMIYVTPRGGSSFGADPIGLLRGAPNVAVAREFIRFVLSPEGGQKLWGWKVGTPGGPRRFALRRLPIHPSLYAPQWEAMRSDPEVDPYRPEGEAFTYRPEWTARLFRPIGFLIGATCIDAHDELRAAWRALVENDFPPEALALFDEMEGCDYTSAQGRVRETLNQGGAIGQIQLGRDLGEAARARYREVVRLAKKQ